MIPIYRAKKLNSDEWLEGYYVDMPYSTRKAPYIIQKDGLSDTVDPKTLAIHFPNMIDKNGKKIFASLSENGVGGDECKDLYDTRIAKFSKLTNSVIVEDIDKDKQGIYEEYWVRFEVTGIHKGVEDGNE